MLTAAALMCLSLNIHHEARGEPVMGQVAVAMVTINRANQRSDRDICKVVYAPHQFSWTTDIPKMGRNIPKGFSWKTSQAIAKMSLKLNPADFGLEDITYFHNTSVNPSWNKGMILVGKHGNHLFWKER